MVVWVGILERFAEVGGGVADDVVEVAVVRKWTDVRSPVVR